MPAAHRGHQSAGKGGFWGTPLNVVFGIWSRRVRHVRLRPLEVEESAESGLHAWSWILVFGTREYVRQGRGHQRWRNQENWGYAPDRGFWCLAQESMPGKAVFIRGGGIDKMGGMQTSVGFSKGDYWGVYTWTWSLMMVPPGHKSIFWLHYKNENTTINRVVWLCIRSKGGRNMVSGECCSRFPRGVKWIIYLHGWYFTRGKVLGVNDRWNRCLAELQNTHTQLSIGWCFVVYYLVMRR